ncbi:hypothetical protein [Sphingomonas sp. 3-13AW]|uniref:hypothetical protein n=1 Tax=Sphingomonas sp. 3-13AW TaxID=3050450 RepID=UPI003BB57C84
MIYALMVLLQGAPIAPAQDYPSLTIASKIHDHLDYAGCFKSNATLRQEYYFHGWYEARKTHIDRNIVVFRVSEADLGSRSAGIFITKLVVPQLDDTDFKFIRGHYNIRTGKLTQGCFSNLG